MNQNHKCAGVLKALACFLAALTSPISTANSQTATVILEAQYLRFASPFFPFPWIGVPPLVRAVPRIPAPRYQQSVTPLTAHDYICTPQRGSVMKEVVETDLFYDGRHWSIAHHLSSGGVAARNEQYALRNSSTRGEGRWEGSLRKNPRLQMVGRFNGWTYVEELFDGKQIVMHAVEDCHTAVGLAQEQPSRPLMPPPPGYTVPARCAGAGA